MYMFVLMMKHLCLTPCFATLSLISFLKYNVQAAKICCADALAEYTKRKKESGKPDEGARVRNIKDACCNAAWRPLNNSHTHDLYLYCLILLKNIYSFLLLSAFKVL
jgi:hypothetical protein